MIEHRVIAADYSSPGSFQNHRYIVMVEDEGKFYVSDKFPPSPEQDTNVLFEVRNYLGNKHPTTPKYFRIDLNTNEVEVVGEKIVEGFERL